MKLSTDESENIREIIAASFLEICKTLRKVNGCLGFSKKILFEFMHDENEQIMTSIVDDLSEYIKMFQDERGISPWEDTSVLDDEEEKIPEPKTTKGILATDKYRVC